MEFFFKIFEEKSKFKKVEIANSPFKFSYDLILDCKNHMRYTNLGIHLICLKKNSKNLKNFMQNINNETTLDYFCDTNPNSGKGHVSRMLTLAEKLKKEKVSFITQSLDHVYCNEIKKAGHDICELNDIKKNKIYKCIIDGNSFKNERLILSKKYGKNLLFKYMIIK